MSDIRPRLEKILALHGRDMLKAVNQREPSDFNDLKCMNSQLSSKDLILRFARADPTDGKSRTQWLVKTYIADERFKLEDLGRATAALVAFERLKRTKKLPLEQRELSRFKSLRELEALVDPFVKTEKQTRLTRDLSSVTGRELRRLECVKARDESVVVQEGKGLPTIVVPMTIFASKWWGRGTKWCTAAEDNNVFDYYHKDAPLVIIVCPYSDLTSSRCKDKSLSVKFQIYVKSDTYHFMDKTDQTVDKETLRERWNELKPIICWMIKQNGRVLQLVPEDYRTYELCLMAVQQYGRALQFVPLDLKSKCIDALQEESSFASKSSSCGDEETPKLCRIAVEQDGMALIHVPEEHITLELYNIAIQQNGWTLQFVPEKYKTLELCNIAIRRDGRALQFTPEEYKTFTLYHIAVQQSGRALRHVPKEYRTLELCYLAIEQNGLTLQYVPEEHKSLDLCRIAVKQDGMALRFVPTNNRTLELCRLAVEQNGMALQHVPGFPPRDYRTPELCLLAIQQKGQALQHVPEKYKTLELCRLAIEQNEEALQFVPEDFDLVTVISPVQPKWHPDILQELNQHHPGLGHHRIQSGNLH
jgi:Domain of unknown function (DUF4116)